MVSGSAEHGFAPVWLHNPCFPLLDSIYGGSRKTEQTRNKCKKKKARSGVPFPGQKPKAQGWGWVLLSAQEDPVEKEEAAARRSGLWACSSWRCTSFMGRPSTSSHFSKLMKTTWDALHSSPCSALGDFPLALGGGGREFRTESVLPKDSSLHLR